VLSRDKHNDDVRLVAGYTNAYVIVGRPEKQLAVFVPLKEQIADLNEVIDGGLLSHLSVLLILRLNVTHVKATVVITMRFQKPVEVFLIEVIALQARSELHCRGRQSNVLVHNR
jgi:uncharacterized protein YpmB